MGYRESDKKHMKKYEKVWKSMKKVWIIVWNFVWKVWKSMNFYVGLLRPYVKTYEMIDENYIFVMNLYEIVWNSMKCVKNIWIHVWIESWRFCFVKLQAYYSINLMHDDSFVAFTAAGLSDTFQDDRLSNSLLETECTDAF